MIVKSLYLHVLMDSCGSLQDGVEICLFVLSIQSFLSTRYSMIFAGSWLEDPMHPGSKVMGTVHLHCVSSPSENSLLKELCTGLNRAVSGSMAGLMSMFSGIAKVQARA